MEGPFLDPGIPDGERTAYRGLVGGDEAGTGAVEVRRVDEDGREGYRQALIATVRDAVEYEAWVTFRRRNGTIFAEGYRLETRQRGEGRIAAEEGRFRQVRALQWGAEIESYPRDLVPALGGAVALRGLELERGARRSFSAWLANTVYWEVETHVEREERIALPVGRLAAWRVLLRPSLEQVDRTLDKLVAGLLPPIVVHLDAAAPHRLLRFEFPTGPYRWNPPGLVEATAFDEDA
jgi:hypothetical protein